MTRQEPDPDFPAVKVDQRWDRHIRSWTTTWIDADGCQTGPAAFAGTRADAAADKRFYEAQMGKQVVK